MVITSLFDVFTSIILWIFGTALNLVPLPVAMIDVLFDILCYGTWVVGADFMALFMTVVVTWFVARWTIGLVVFLWELLPLT